MHLFLVFIVTMLTTFVFRWHWTWCQYFTIFIELHSIHLCGALVKYEYREWPCIYITIGFRFDLVQSQHKIGQHLQQKDQIPGFQAISYAQPVNTRNQRYSNSSIMLPSLIAIWVLSKNCNGFSFKWRSCRCGIYFLYYSEPEGYTAYALVSMGASSNGHILVVKLSLKIEKRNYIFFFCGVLDTCNGSGHEYISRIYVNIVH